jgi:hypothetical protein
MTGERPPIEPLCPAALRLLTGLISFPRSQDCIIQ